MATNKADILFTETAEQILKEMWDAHPNFASWLGLHEYDGRLPDISQSALSRRARQLEKAVELLEQIELLALSRQNYFDCKLLMSSLQREHFELTELKPHETNPIRMVWAMDFGNYIHRDYAPLEQRVQSLTKALKAVPSYLDSVKANLKRRLPRPILEFAIESYQGIASFYDNELAQAVASLANGELKQAFDDARAAASKAVRAFADFLRSLEDQATARFSIGADCFRGLLKRGEMVDMPLERLLEVGQRDLERNLARFRRVASDMDSARSPAEVMSTIGRDHPSSERLIPETRDMLEELRQWVIDCSVVSVPSELRCETRETPPFARWAFAAMDIPGPLETRATESFYYVTPPETHWSDAQKEQWLASFNYSTLRAVSIHEAYPGHYVHYLHTRLVPSKISRIISSYAFSEGWAHYAEEMMIEQGYGSGDPRLELGQLSEALLRNCRYICAIKMHTQGMTVDEATRFFIENAFLEELPASKEATRGAFDAMYLNYTLGKLMIMKLREDCKRERGEGFSLREFHDTLLSYGSPPVPLLREMMLRNPGSEVV